MRALFGALLVAIILTLPSHADAARLWSSGCELQVLEEDAGPGEMEWIAMGAQAGALSISTSIFNSGLASCRVNTTGGNYEFFFHDHVSANSTESFFMRAYVYFASTPGGTTQFMTVGSSGEDEGAIGIGADMILRLYSDDMSTVQDTAVSALSTGTWYRIEWNYDSGGTSEVRVDGVQVLTDPTHNGDGFTGFTFGSVGIDFGGENANIYFDDFALNDTTGGSQTSWPGAGSIVHMHPDGGAGDNSDQNSGTCADVDEVTPDDTTTKAVLGDASDLMDCTVESSSSAGIDSYDTITLIQAGVRDAATGSIAYTARLKSASGGTVSEGTQTSHNDATYKTNGDATPRNYTLTSYTDPTTASAWTPTGTNSLDNMQIGLELSLSIGPDVNLSTLWALIEYVDGAPAASNAIRARLNGGRIKVNGGRFRQLSI